MARVKKFQNNFTTGVVGPGLAARYDLQKYASGCRRIINAVVRPHGGLSNRPGTLLIGEVKGDGILFPFSYNSEQSYVICLAPHKGLNDNTYVNMSFYLDGGQLINNAGTPVELDTGLPADVTNIRFVQSADTLFMVHPSMPPTRLIRSVSGEDASDASWSIEELSFKPTLPAPEGLETEPTGFVDKSDTYVEDTIEYKVAAVDERENESLPSQAAEAKVLSTWVQGAKVRLTWQAVAGAVRYEVYKNSRGYYGWVGSAETTEFTDDNIEADSGISPKDNREPFVGDGNMPGAIGIYQQRLVFGRTDNEPQTVWFSEVGSFDSLAVSYPQRDDNAITVTVDSRQMNEIRHFVPLKTMLMLTSGAEFVVSPGNNADAVTPTSIRFDLQSYWGCSNLPPLVVGTSVLMADNSGRRVRDMFYQLSEDGYSGSELTILAEHLIDSPIRDWAYQQYPYSTVWICLENGRLLTFTYMREQEIWAWSEHESAGGKFRSVCSIRNGGFDDVYFLVERDGKFYIEFQARRDYGDAIEEAVFLDSSLQYTGEDAVRVITGLEHLIGKGVTALADGRVVRGLTVDMSGSVTLPVAAKYVTIGLPRRMLIETLDPEITASEGVMEGEPRSVARASIKVRETLGLKIGPDEERMDDIKFPMQKTWGGNLELFTGSLDVALPGKYRDEATVCIVQDDPLPATILGLNLYINIGQH